MNHAQSNGHRLAAIITQEVKREMLESARPVLTKVFVPDQYRILLHPDDYDWIRPVERELVTELKEHLDDVLEELNAREGYLSGPLELLRWLQRIPLIGHVVQWFVEPVRPSDGRSYEVRGPWHIEILASDDITRGEAGIEAWVSEESTRRTTETGRTMTGKDASSKNGDPGETVKDPHKTISSTITLEDVKDETDRGSASVRAKLHYTGEEGSEVVYEMTKDEIKVGRGSPSVWVDVELGFVEKDISRKHLRIRYNASRDRVEIKDVSTYGTAVNGKPIDPDVWHPLPDGATIVMADRDDHPVEVVIPSTP